MSTTTLLPGVRLHPNGRSYQVRVAPFPAEAGFASPEDANEYALELRRLKREGITTPPRRRTDQPYTLAEATRRWLRKLDRDGGTRGRALTPGGRREYRRAGNPWLGVRQEARYTGERYKPIPEARDQDGRLLADLPLKRLRRYDVDEYLAERRATTPKQARAERQALLQILQLARDAGHAFGDELLALKPIRVDARVGVALEPDELAFLAARAPEHQRRWFELAGTIGARIMSLLRAHDTWLDLDRKTITIPAAEHKSGNVAGDLEIDLLDDEVRLFREQLLARAPGTTLIFPRRGGSPWRHGHFYDKVWVPTRRRAQRDWRAEHELPADAPTPFDELRPHDLRHTAATTLCELILDDALVALRLGHNDGGKLVRERYRHVNRRKLRAELDRIDAERAAREEAA